MISVNIFILPSAGEDLLLNYYQNSISLDIEPRYWKIIEQDYLEWFPQII